MAQGGIVSIGAHSFATEDALRKLVMAELPSGDAITAFVDPATIFAHDKTAQDNIAADSTACKEKL